MKLGPYASTAQPTLRENTHTHTNTRGITVNIRANFTLFPCYVTSWKLSYQLTKLETRVRHQQTYATAARTLPSIGLSGLSGQTFPPSRLPPPVHESDKAEWWRSLSVITAWMLLDMSKYRWMNMYPNRTWFIICFNILSAMKETPLWEISFIYTLNSVKILIICEWW